MGTEGYRTQDELGTHRLWDEVLVAVDRRGRVHLVDGAHRLALAQVLRLPEIPVLVAVRHAEWDEFRRSMIQYARDRGEGVYQRLDHPDLAVVPYVHGSDRWPMIEAHLPPGGGTALDIGANAGLFSFALARRGFRVTAVERSEKEAYVLGRLVAASSLPIRVVKASIFDAPLEKHYCVVLALNIFHHFLKTEPTLRLLEGLLGGLTADFVFFESHDPDEVQMRGAYFNPAPRDFAEWVAGRLGLDSVRLIGTPEGRSLFLLERGEVPAE
jgi:SAM-dependent methyltransferase